jgi:hypothetical protein
MAQTAAHLVDHVIPRVPVRQGVLSLPIPLRRLLASQPQLLTSVLQVVQRVLMRHLLEQAGLGADVAHDGAISLIQRFGSAANLNIHLHCLVLGGGVLELKASWRDGTTHLVMSPLEFLQRLAAVVPRPMLHLIRFHGVLAPNARLRAQVVSQGAQETAEVRPTAPPTRRRTARAGRALSAADSSSPSTPA